MKSASCVCTGYTFPVKIVSWLVLIAVIAGIGFAISRWRRRAEERERTAEDRMAAFIAQAAPAAPTPLAAPAAPPIDAGALLQQKLLLEAASKAGDAGEAALSIQLYARLLARYPASALAGAARAAVEEQKKRLARR
jgi:hypothetical protein